MSMINWKREYAVLFPDERENLKIRLGGTYSLPFSSMTDFHRFLVDYSKATYGRATESQRKIFLEIAASHLGVDVEGFHINGFGGCDLPDYGIFGFVTDYSVKIKLRFLWVNFVEGINPAQSIETDIFYGHEMNRPGWRDNLKCCMVSFELDQGSKWENMTYSQMYDYANDYYLRSGKKSKVNWSFSIPSFAEIPN